METGPVSGMLRPEVGGRRRDHAGQSRDEDPGFRQVDLRLRVRAVSQAAADRCCRHEVHREGGDHLDGGHFGEVAGGCVVGA
jgi:hypothetical protein